MKMSSEKERYSEAAQEIRMQRIAAEAAEREAAEAAVSGEAADVSDDLGLPWGQWADGRLWRLKRGKHYKGDSRLVMTAARHAARAMGRAVETTRDAAGKRFEYVWVQFADAEIFIGERCVCGGTKLASHHPARARCTKCGRNLILKEP